MRKIIFSLVILLLICLLGCAKPPVGPVRPNVGDKATVRLFARPLAKAKFVEEHPEYARRIPSLEYRLMIRCNKAQNDKREFGVYYLNDKNLESYAYKVIVDYSMNDIDKRTKVIDGMGKVVPRGGVVDELPVPFEEMLFFDEPFLKCLPLRRRLADGEIASICRARTGRNNGSYMQITIGKPEDTASEASMRKSRSVYDIQQAWSDRGQWLWWRTSGGRPFRCEYRAIREH